MFGASDGNCDLCGQNVWSCVCNDAPIATTNSPVDCSLPEKICARCMEEVDELFPANCNEKPELLIGQPIGMYHCPDCGTAVLAGMNHFDLCKRCIDRCHPGIDVKV